MKVNFNQALKQSDGATVLLDGTDGHPVTLRDICINSLLRPVEKEGREEKWKKYEFYKKLRDGTEVMDLKSEEISKLKELIALFHPQLVMGQCFEMLEKEK